MKTVVMGYHTMGCLGFDALLRHGFDVAAVFTHRDDPNEEVWWDSLAERAKARGIPVYYPETMKNPKWAEIIRSIEPDFIFSFYFRFMIPPEILEIPKMGALNLHGSLLPRYRGRAPVNWVLVNGESETGVSLHYMVAKPDAGNLVDQERVPIAFEDTARSLFAKLESAADRLLERTLPKLRLGTAPSIPLDLSKGSYFGGRKPEDGRIDWAWPSVRIYNLIRAVTHPYPGAFTTARGRKLYIWWGMPETRLAADGAARERAGQNVGSVSTSTACGMVTSVGPDGVRVATGDGEMRLVKCQLEGEVEEEAAVCAARNGIVVGTILGA